MTSGPGCLVVKVRHAQDIEAEVFEGDWDWATATIRVRSLTDFDEPDGVVLFEGVLDLPDGCLSVGDGDSEVTVNDLSVRSRVRGDNGCAGPGALVRSQG